MANATILSRGLTGLAAAGPLVVSKTNPRYFTVLTDSAGNDRAVYLTGSHIWNNLHDGLGAGKDCAALTSRGITAKRPYVGNAMRVTEVSDPDGYHLLFQSPTDVAEETVFAGEA